MVGVNVGISERSDANSIYFGSLKSRHLEKIKALVSFSEFIRPGLYLWEWRIRVASLALSLIRNADCEAVGHELTDE